MLRVRVLGPFEVEGDLGLLALGSVRRRALLALLALNAGRVVRAERLVDALWGEAPPKTASHVLQVYVSDLRRALPEGVLATVDRGYQLRIPSDALDLADFERHVNRGQAALSAADSSAAILAFDEALALWRGPVLDDLADEGFVKVEARRLEELRLAAREMRASALLAHGGGPDLVPELMALIDEHPFRERPHALLMQALAAQGRQAEALDVFTALRRRLSDELGIEPGEELRSTQAAVLRQETPTAAEDQDRSTARTGSGTVIAVATEPSRLADLADAAALPAAATDRELLLAVVLDAASTDPAQLPGAAAAARSAGSRSQGPVRTAAFRSRHLARDVADLSGQHEANLVLLDAAGETDSRGRLSPWLADALEQITPDVVLLPGEAPQRDVPVGVPFGGSHHDWAAAELGALLARALGTSLRVIGALSDEDDASRLVATVGLAIQRAVGVDVEPVLAEASSAGLLAALGGTTAVIGVSERWRSEGVGRFRHELVAASPGALVIRRGVRPGLLAPTTSQTRFAWSVVI